MNSRWFIPCSLLGFAGLVTALWLYLSAAEERSARPPRYAVADQELEDWTHSNAPKSAPDPLAAAHDESMPPGLPPWDAVRSDPILPRIAERLDEASRDLRLQAADNVVVRVVQASTEFRTQRYDAALRTCDEILKASPQNAGALEIKAGALAAVGRLTDAAGVFKHLIELVPRSATARYNYGVVLLRQSKFGEAAEQFSALVALDPRHAKGQYNLASLAQRAGRLIEAREAWEAFTRLSPEEPSGWFNLGVTRMDLDDTPGAADSFEHYTARAPEDPTGYINLAAAYAAVGRVTAAREVMDLALEVSPCNADVLANREELNRYAEEFTDEFQGTK